jgi:hypothetical protein
LYLNKGVFEAADAAGPYTFDAADMTKVVTNVDAINSSLSTDYWDNFKPDNNTSPEILFSVNMETVGGISNISGEWVCITTNSDGWNGFATVSEFL